MSLRSITVGIVGLLMVAALSPAAGGAQESQQVESLTIATEADKGNLTPYSFRPPPGLHSELVGLVYDTLFLDPYTEEPIPWLATEASSSEDAKTWTVELREGVEWQDGEEFDADDVAFTYTYYKDSPPNRYTHHASSVPVIDSVEALDPQTVRFDCAQPCPTLALVTLADLPILPQHVWENVEDPMTFTELPMGTGPYKLVEHTEDQSYRFEANEDYFLGPPAVGELVMPIVKDPSSMFLALQSGQVDSVTLPIPSELQSKLEGNDEIELIDGNRYTSVFYRINPESPPLDQPEFRNALGLAIDRQALVETILLGEGRPGSPSFMHPDSDWFRPQEATFAQERARNILDEIGITDSDGDGVREYEGEPVGISVIVPANAPLPVRTAELVARQLEEIGIDLKVQSLDPGTLSQRQNAGEFDLASFIGVPHLLGDPDQMIESLDSLLVYPNPEYEELKSEWFQADTIEQRRELLFEIQALFVDDPPALTLYYPDTIYGYRPAAYDGWIPVKGHGIHHKWSFIPEAEAMLEREGASQDSQGSQGSETTTSQQPGDGAGGSSMPVYALAGAGSLAVVALAGFLWWRSRDSGEEEI